MPTLSTRTNQSALRELVRSFEPTASVFLGRSTGVPGPVAEHDAALRWNALRSRLWEDGADADTIGAVGEYLATIATVQDTALFASGGVLRLVRHLPGLDTPDRAAFTAPARILPVLAWQQYRPAHVVVVIDRAGADVTPVPAGELSGDTLVVAGPDDEIEHNAPGGWSQPRYHRRAVDSWQHNASAVAMTAAYAVERIDAGLILLAGDVRAAQMFRTHLPHGLHARLAVREVPGGRSTDGSWPARQAAIAAAVHAYVDEQTLALRDRIVAERGPGGHAVDGIEPTLAALSAGRVDTLLLTDESGDRRTAWFGADALCSDMPPPGEPTASQARLVDVAARAALLTDADIRVLAPEVAAALADGIGALCRFS